MRGGSDRRAIHATLSNTFRSRSAAEASIAAAVPGLVLEEAERETEDGKVVYSLEGTAESPAADVQEGAFFLSRADPNFVVNADLNNDGIFDLVTVNADEGAGTGSVTALLAAPEPPIACPWDCQAVPSGSVDVPDLLALLAAWGGPPGAGTTCDLDGSGVIAVPDLLKLLASWGPCPQ